MGSSGTNTFTDYPGSSGGRPGGTGGGGAGDGGKSDKCELAIVDLTLEEVALAEYFTTHKKPPSAKTRVRVRKRLVDGRVAVETESDNEVIGYVPTAYNYLRQCMAKGWSYTGEVTSSSARRIPNVQVDLVPDKK